MSHEDSYSSVRNIKAKGFHLDDDLLEIASNSDYINHDNPFENNVNP
jgi:hypothetical protein